jgi:hypothetical protein
MRRLTLLVVILLLASPLAAQSIFGGAGTNPQGRTWVSGATCPPVATPTGGVGSIYTCTTTGAIYSWSGSAWSAAGGGSGTVTSIATTSPITGGTITGTGTIACPTCIGGSLGATQIPYGTASNTVGGSDSFVFDPTSTATILRVGPPEADLPALIRGYTGGNVLFTVATGTDYSTGVGLEVNGNDIAFYIAALTKNNGAANNYGTAIDIYSGGDSTGARGYASFVSANGHTNVPGMGYYSYAPGGTPVEFQGFYQAALTNAATNGYSFWHDEAGVFRIKADNTFNSVYQAIPALYNPQVLKYTAGAKAFERWALQWESNVAVLTTEAGPTQTLTSVTSASTTATATLVGHGYRTGDSVTVAGAAQGEYNGTYTVTRVSDNVFTYTFAGSVTTPATGTITAQSGTLRPMRIGDTGVNTTFGGTVQPTGYKSSDGSAGVTVSACTSFKNGLCVAGT